jgi:hypothetical protein
MSADHLQYTCPFCDSQVIVGKPCPGCKKATPKKRKKRSWEQSETYDGLDLPDDDFDYDEYVAREFGKTPHRQIGIPWYWWLLAIALLVAMGAGLFFQGR